VHPLILRTATIAWNTMLLRFNREALVDYPKRAFWNVVVLIFSLDCILGVMGGNYQQFSLPAGIISAVLDVVIILVAKRNLSYEVTVAFAVAVLVGSISAVILKVLGFENFTYVVTIWIGIVFYKLCSRSRAQESSLR